MGPAMRFLARALTWPLLPALLVWHPPSPDAGQAGYLAAMGACWVVGVMVTWLAFGEPAGWAYLGLGSALGWSAAAEAQALRTGDDLMAALASSSWVWWFVFAALAVQLTLPKEARPHRLAMLTVGLGGTSQSLMLLRSGPLDQPFAHLSSPWAPERFSGAVDAVSYAVVLGLGLCLLASVWALFRGWRRSAGQERQQLLWLVAGLSPLAPAVVAAYLLAYAGLPQLAVWPLSVAFAALAAGAALSVLRYRLYDVERIVSESAAYAIASATVLVSFGVVVVVISRTTPLGERSQLPTIAATVVGMVAARQSLVWARRAVDRKLDRTRFEAVEAITRSLASGPTALDEQFRRALGDPSVRLLYPTGNGTWVTEAGHLATPAEHVVDVRGAKVEYDPLRVKRDDVAAVATAAATEIDNVALRAELARQVEAVTDSRARLASAHLDERLRLERDLHDGAQQRILAIALRLQSARLNGSADVLGTEVDSAVAHLGVTVEELRALAHGLQPAALATGGLLAAVADLADRLPIRVVYDVPEVRFEQSAEGTAWFVIAEAVANAVKHASSDVVHIEVTREADALAVTVTDTGVGGADADGHGLRGLHDRVAARGGSLAVEAREPSGTLVRAVLPCAS